MNKAISPQEALHHYREASQNWLSLRNEQSTGQLRLQALLLSTNWQCMKTHVLSEAGRRAGLHTKRPKLEIEWLL